MPERLDPALATLGVLGSVAYHIVERGAPRLLEPTAIVGQGVVGSLILQLARQCGARPLIALDADAKRLEMAKELGADAVVDVSQEDAAARVKALTGGKGVSCCIEAAANHRAYETAISILALRGRLVLASAVYEPVSFRIDLDLIHRELTLIGAHQPKVPVEENPYYPYTMALNRTATMEGIRDGRLKVAHLVSHRIKPADATEVYERLRAKDRSFVGVVIDWR
ncbi:MAG: zinc-binding dehydrogenase [Planctomycetota bacterium]|nr:zinc-binding dehydrogenase [Planctomycetota bacterium]